MSPPPPLDVGFEHDFAGRSGTSTSADHYAAPEEFASYDGEQPGNTCPTDASEFDEDNDSDKVNGVYLFTGLDHWTGLLDSPLTPKY